MDGEAWTGRANLEQPEVVQRVHEAYVRAGAVGCAPDRRRIDHGLAWGRWGVVPDLYTPVVGFADGYRETSIVSES
jgi:hypothetical protein